MYIDMLFDGPPVREPPQFIEVEDEKAEVLISANGCNDRTATGTAVSHYPVNSRPKDSI
jgi:hypothetical protein